MQTYSEDSKRTLTRLVGRYGRERGLYLFGELCLLKALGLEAFRQRHTESQLNAIAIALSPLDLWPDGQPHVFDGHEALASIAASLVTPPLVLRVGADLFWGMAAWADGGPDLTAWFTPASTSLSESLGFPLPKLELFLDMDLASTAYRLAVAGEVVEEGMVYPHLDLILGPEDGPPPELPYAWTPDPAGPGWVAWMPIGPEAQPPADLPRLHWLTALGRHLAARLPRHASRLLTAPRVHELLLQAEQSGYDHELERYVSVPELRLVFRALLDQGVPLTPLGKILEGLTQELLRELAGRALPMEEIERLQRQLPVFSTPRLVVMARRALGLALQPPPPFALTPPPGPVRHASAPSESQRREIEALLATAAYEEAGVRFWVCYLRGRATVDDRATGRFLRYWLRFGPERAAVPAPLITERLGEQGLLSVLEMLRRHRALTRALACLRGWLDDPARPLSAEAAAMLAAPRWASWRWGLQEPARLAARLGLETELAAFTAAIRA